MNMYVYKTLEHHSLLLINWQIMLKLKLSLINTIFRRQPRPHNYFI